MEEMEAVLDRLLLNHPKAIKRKIAEALEADDVLDEATLKQARLDDVPHLSNVQARALVRVGLLLSRNDKSRCKSAQELGKSIRDLADVQFGQVKKFSGVPWPGLDSTIPARVRADANRKLDFIGRTGFPALELEFLELPRKQGMVLDYDGPMGAGKTYYLVMLAIKLLHDFAAPATGSAAEKVSAEAAAAEKVSAEAAVAAVAAEAVAAGKASAEASGGQRRPRRLVCVFSTARAPVELERTVRDALLVAFWEDKTVQFRICAEQSLQLLVSDLKEDYDLYFIYDNWSKYEPSCRDFLEEIARGCPCIRGGSARQDLRLGGGAYPNLHKGQYEGFDAAEIEAYLGSRQVDRDDMLLWTGNFPLYVRLYLAEGDNYQKSNEVVALEWGLYKMVHDVLALTGEERRSRLESLARLMVGEGNSMDFLVAEDTRWITLKEGKVQLVSQFARALLIAKMKKASEAS